MYSKYLIIPVQALLLDLSDTSSFWVDSAAKVIVLRDFLIVAAGCPVVSAQTSPLAECRVCREVGGGLDISPCTQR